MSELSEYEIEIKEKFEEVINEALSIKRIGRKDHKHKLIKEFKRLIDLYIKINDLSEGYFLEITKDLKTEIDNNEQFKNIDKTSQKITKEIMHIDYLKLRSFFMKIQLMEIIDPNGLDLEDVDLELDEDDLDIDDDLDLDLLESELDEIDEDLDEKPSNNLRIESELSKMVEINETQRKRIETLVEIKEAHIFLLKEERNNTKELKEQLKDREYFLRELKQENLKLRKIIKLYRELYEDAWDDQLKSE